MGDCTHADATAWRERWVRRLAMVQDRLIYATASRLTLYDPEALRRERHALETAIARITRCPACGRWREG